MYVHTLHPRKASQHETNFPHVLVSLRNVFENSEHASGLNEFYVSAVNIFKAFSRA